MAHKARDMKSVFPHISKTKLSQYSLLGSAKMRKKHGLFVAEGLKCVKDLLQNFNPVAIIGGQETLGELRDERCVCYEASAAEMEKLSQLSTPSSVLAIFKLPEPAVLSVSNGIYLALDGVQDPGNMGTILRLADWFGVAGVLASYDCVDIFNPKTVQATMGALGRVKVSYCELSEALAKYKDRIQIYGTLLDGSNIYKAELQENCILVMGNEGKGISAKVREQLTARLLIPPYPASRLGTPGCSESLNVAMATAVALSEMRRREYSGGKK